MVVVVRCVGVLVGPACTCTCMYVVKLYFKLFTLSFS